MSSELAVNSIENCKLKVQPKIEYDITLTYTIYFPGKK